MNRRAKTFIASVVVMGPTIAIGALVIGRVELGGLGFAALAMCAGFALVCDTIQYRHRGQRSTGSVVTLNSTFFTAPFLIVDPRAVVLGIWATVLADAVMTRKKPIQVAFNIGQMALSASAAAGVLLLSGATFDLNTLGFTDLLFATIALFVYLCGNWLLVHTVVYFVSRKASWRENWWKRGVYTSEMFQIGMGIVLALMWHVEPWLLPLAAIPMLAQSRMLGRSLDREQRLEAQDRELRAVSRLGLEIGSQLDRERLSEEILDGSCQALGCTSSLLLRSSGSDAMRVEASKGLDQPAPERIDIRGICEHDGRRVLRLSSLDVDDVPGLKFLAADDVLIARLKDQGETSALVLARGVGGGTFTEEHERRLEFLLPFIDVALSNATLVERTERLHEHLSRNEKLAAVGRMMTGIAHELNNPLAAVVGFGELLAEDPPEERRNAMLSQVVVQSQRAGKIVRSLLQWFGPKREGLEAVDVARLLDDLTRFRAYAHGVNDIVILKEIAPELPAVLGDVDQLSQVLLNLMVNAEQAIAEAGVDVGEIRITAAPYRDQVRITVADNGCGMTDDVRRRLFEPFFTTKDVGEGTGLGLYVCHQIVEAHGGSIDVSSSIGRGATFTIDLPRMTAAPPPQPPRPTFHLPRNLSALVVDDEPAIGELLGECLGSLDWHVDVVRDGRAALEQLGGRKYDVLLVDLKMPGFDGLEFSRRLAETHPALLRRLIFVTGDPERLATDSNPTISKAPRLYKPFVLDELYGTIGRIVDSDGAPVDN